ncbi:MAG: hypothetical protein ABMA64_13830 [Myxococcota bacterium]
MSTWMWFAAACEVPTPFVETEDSGVDTGNPTASTEGPRLSELQEGLFTPACTTGCHDARTAAGGLVLEPGTSWAQLVGVPANGLPAARRVSPGASVNSYLVMKLEGASEIVGLRMPIGTALDPTAVTPVRAWIDAGALDN